MKRQLAAVALAGVLAGQSMQASGQVAIAPRPTPSYQEMVTSVANMVSDGELQALVGKRGMQVLNVLWEDTGRWEGSSVGPNISDVTIEVQTEGPDGKRMTQLMPVIRHPNFTDKTGDVKIDQIRLRVGNQQKDGALKTITLAELLRNPLEYMSFPRAGVIKGGTLLAKRDTHALVSAQATFLPVPKQGKATFWPVIFNYQSYKDNPAVLTILVTRQGISMTIVDNARDTVTGGMSWGQRLFFNKAGMAAPLTAERLADVKASGKTSNGEDASTLGDDANLLMLIQVPLKVKQRYNEMAGGEDYGADEGAPMPAPPSATGAKTRSAAPDMDVAVLGHGPVLGPYTELAGLTIERDDRFPVRATVQFYQATSSGNIGEAEISKLGTQIDKVYASADYVGSLVVPGAQKRPTQWTGHGAMPMWVTWRHFAGLVERFEKYGRLMFWNQRTFRW